jgi:arsenite methyltransferase
MASCCASLYELPIVEHLLGGSFHPGGVALTRRLASTALIAPDSKVLDVACGTGSSARVITADLGASVIGCDYSAFNLERAKRAATAMAPLSSPTFVRAAAEQLPFEPGSFDAAICECSLCLFENKDVVLEQIRRVLRPGGRIGISDFFLNKPVPDSLTGLLSHVLCVGGASSLEGYRRSLSQAGFEFVRIREANQTLIDMSRRIRRRMRSLTTTGIAELPDDWGDPASVLHDLERFICSGGAGYMLAVGRRP